MPKWSGTIYELLSAPVSFVEVVIGYVGAPTTKSVVLGVLILVTARIFVPYEIEHPLWMIAFLLLTAVSFSLFGFIVVLWADEFQQRSDESREGNELLRPSRSRCSSYT